MHTENRSEHYVILKPLYFCDPRKPDEKGISYQVRPLEFFEGDINRPEYTGKRFTLIEDTVVIEKLKQEFLFSSDYLEE